MTARQAFEAYWLSRWDDKEEGRRSLDDDDEGYAARDWRIWQASRKQMAEEAAAVCAALIPSGCSTTIADVSRNQGIRACADAVRALATPTEGKT